MWKKVEVENRAKVRNVPSASIGYGRIGLNVAACELIDNYEKYKFAEIFSDSEQSSAFGIQFLEESTPNSIVIKRKQANGKPVGGIELSSKAHLEKMFGVLGIGTQKKTTRYSVKRDKSLENFLVLEPR